MRVDDDDALFEAAAFDDDQGDAEPEPTRDRGEKDRREGNPNDESTRPLI